MAIKVETRDAAAFADIGALYRELPGAHETLMNGTGRGSDFLGWIGLPASYFGGGGRALLKKIRDCADRIRADSEILLVIGIGGSYLGTRAALEYLGLENSSPKVVFAGNTLSAARTEAIISELAGKDFSINVISKSGTTTEPAVAFRIFRGLLEERYGNEEAAKRIYTTTDKSRGALKGLADTLGYESFVIPDDVGGRFSVLTPVGLLPLAAAGADIEKILEGAAKTAEVCAVPGGENPAWAYAAARNALYRAGFGIEILACYEPCFRFMGEWWKQLYGESEGKEGRGIFPAFVELTADLHSMGQYIQEGARNLFETVVSFEAAGDGLTVPRLADDSDGLNFLAGMPLDKINEMARRGTLLAHVDGGTPNIGVRVKAPDESSFGALVYFFEFACALSGYLLGVNPFDQPGVEAYKKNMYALIGKPGFEELRARLEKRL